MNLLDEIIKSIFELRWLVLIFLVPTIIYFSVEISRKHKRQKKARLNKTQNQVLETIEVDNEEFVGPQFGFENLKNPVEFQKEAQEIMKQVNGAGQISVDFAKAMYILKNFKSYNVFSNEDGKIIFKKLKEKIDRDSEIDQDIVKNNKSERELIKIDEEPHNVTVKDLGNGRVQVFNPNGYSILENNVIVEGVNYNDELKELEEQKKNSGDKGRIEQLQVKIDNLERILLKKSKVKEVKFEIKDTDIKGELDEKKVVTKKVVAKKTKKPVENTKNNETEINQVTTKLNDDIENLLGNFEELQSAQVTNESKTSKTKISNKVDIEKEETTEEIEKEESQIDEVKKETLCLSNSKITTLNSEYKLFEAANMVSILSTFTEDFKKRKIELLGWLMDHENLFDKGTGVLFIDMDVQKKVLYVNAYLFINLFSKFFKKPSDLYKSLLMGGEIINPDNLKKILVQLNNCYAVEFQKTLFKFAGKSESPFKQKIVTYTTTRKHIVDAQMIMINLEIEDENFSEKISEIKNNIISIHRPQVFVANIAQRKDYEGKVENIGIKYFNSQEN